MIFGKEFQRTFALYFRIVRKELGGSYRFRSVNDHGHNLMRPGNVMALSTDSLGNFVQQALSR